MFLCLGSLSASCANVACEQASRSRITQTVLNYPFLGALRRPINLLHSGACSQANAFAHLKFEVASWLSPRRSLPADRFYFALAREPEENAWRLGWESLMTVNQSLYYFCAKSFGRHVIS